MCGKGNGESFTVVALDFTNDYIKEIYILYKYNNVNTQCIEMYVCVYIISS